MNKKILLSILLVSVLLVSCTPFAHAGTVKNSTTLVRDTIGEPETIDPAWAYDTSSGAVIQQVYETLIFNKINWQNGPYTAGLTDQFNPIIATAVPTAFRTTGVPAGFIKALDFTVKTSAPFPHFSDGNPVTAADVAYSFQRVLVQDRDGGPQWMLYYPLLGTYAASSPTDDPNFGTKIATAITSSGNTVTFNFKLDFPLTTWLEILAQTWGSVVEKSWAVGLGDFDGDFAGHTWQYIWTTWHNPATSFIGDHMMGSGPYMFDYWTHGVAYAIKYNPNYWQGWPAPVTPGDTSGERLAGYLTNIVWNYISAWTARRPRLLAGDSDMADSDRQYRDQILGQPGIRAYFPFPVLSSTAFFYTFDITPTSPWLGTPGGLPAGTFGTGGIPPNIFNDINTRRGFAYAFDYNSWLSAAVLGEGTQPASPILPQLSYSNPANPLYAFNMTKAQYYLELSWGGKDSRASAINTPVLPEDPSKITTTGALWNGGMKFVVTYNTGNVGRQTAAEMIQNNINSLNGGKFQLSTAGVPWGSTYLPQLVAGELPIFIIGWLADYPDPDDFAFPFMHSQGTFSGYQHYNNATVDYLVSTGANTASDPTDTTIFNVANPFSVFNTWSGKIPAQPYTTIPDTRYPRRSIYYALQYIYYQDVPSVNLVQALGRHFERDWVRNWYYNPIYPEFDYYHMWKAATTTFGDCSGATAGIQDGSITVGDAAWVSAHFNPVGFNTGLPFNPSADMTGGKGGLSGSENIVGMSDGIVDIADFNLVNTYFGL